MPANTPNLALPYPVPADAVDVPRDMQALATKLDGISALVPPVVTSLPGSPVDGQEVYYKVAFNPPDYVTWHLRYESSSPLGEKWMFLGGPPLIVDEVTEIQPSGTGTTWQPTTPSLAFVPYGVYRVEVCGRVYNFTTGSGAIGLGVTFGSSGDPQIQITDTMAQGQARWLKRFGVFVFSSGGTAATCKFIANNVGGPSASIVQRGVALFPQRLS
jgi:hypothetical protein